MFPQENIEMIRSSVNVGELLKASFEIKENVGREVEESCEVKNCTSDSSSETEEEFVDESFEVMDNESFYKLEKVESSGNLPPEDPKDNGSTFENQEVFQQLEANFVESVKLPRKTSTTSENHEKIPESEALKPSSGLITKFREILRSSNISVFAGDVLSSKEASDSILCCVPQVHFNETTQSCSRDDGNGKNSNKETPPCISRHASKTSNTFLQKTSTFLSDRDIFAKTMAVRRKNFNGDELTAGKEAKNLSCSGSESNFNESIKHVCDFTVDE
jgi:hypothetical protein